MAKRVCGSGQGLVESVSMSRWYWSRVFARVECRSGLEWSTFLWKWEGLVKSVCESRWDWSSVCEVERDSRAFSGVGEIGQEYLWEQAGLDKLSAETCRICQPKWKRLGKYVCRSGWDCSRFSVGVGGIG